MTITSARVRELSAKPETWGGWAWRFDPAQLDHIARALALFEAMGRQEPEVIEAIIDMLSADETGTSAKGLPEISAALAAALKWEVKP